MSWSALYNDYVYRATLQGRNQQGDPTYGTPEKIDVRRERIQVEGEEDGATMGTKDRITTAEAVFNDTDLIWFSEDDQTNEDEGHVPDETGWSQTAGDQLSRAVL